MIVLGLTGSIGMGKSTTARMFADAGAAVYDADAAVHQLYRGTAVPLIEAAFPGTTAGGVVDRDALGQQVVGDAAALRRLEEIVHPLVLQEEVAFLARARAAGRRVAVLDIPLLFETGGVNRVHATIVVTASAEVQRARVLARPGMTEVRYEALLARQLSDTEKRRRSHFLVDTSGGFAPAQRTVASIFRAVAALA